DITMMAPSAEPVGPVSGETVVRQFISSPRRDLALTKTGPLGVPVPNTARKGPLIDSTGKPMSSLRLLLLSTSAERRPHISNDTPFHTRTRVSRSTTMTDALSVLRMDSMYALT